MKFYKILFLSFGLLIGHIASAQTIKEFSRDSIKYQKEIEKLFLDADKKKYKPFVEEFTLNWFGGKFTEKERNTVYDISNIMLKKRMRTGEFRPFLFSLISFVNSSLSDENFNAWVVSLQELLNGRKKSKYVQYLEVSANLFSDNILYKSASTTWQSSNNNYKFVFDEVPQIIFEDLDLKCYAKKDSSIIRNTSGVYYPTQQRWIGKNGKITWERVGLSENETYAIINDYEVSIKSSKYKIDTAIFYNSFFENPIQGSVTENILSKTGENASYPRFESFDKRLLIPDLVDGVDYEGGFTLYGARLLGSGTVEEPALLTFYRDDVPFLVSRSLNYSIKPDKISSASSAVTFFLEEDSIYHPGLTFKFVRKDRLLTLVRDEEGVSQAPYSNSFHNIEMTFEALYWNIDDPTIEMGTLFGSTDKKANFESVNYYRESRYEVWQLHDRVHPLVQLKDVSAKLGSNVFTALDLAQEMRLQVNEIIPLLIKLSNSGFISYDIKGRIITVREKTFDYIRARGGIIDYDVITINSEVKKKNNATLNLLNYDLLIRGIQQVNLSDSQLVAAFPADQIITMKRNRNFQWLGAMAAGKTTYYGKEFTFDYDEFRVNLLNIDSMALRAETLVKDEYGQTRQVRVRSVIEGIKGHILIDNPFNKSGIQDDYPEYPILHSLKKSYVFYDKRNKQGGAYTRDNFYFQLTPFVLDSLDDYGNESINLAGTFVSAGIFPDFEEHLTIQEDYSLGFIRNTPPDGFEIYGDNGDYNNEIRLSNDGLQGDGSIDFLNSTSTSEEFTFLPDSVVGEALFVNKEFEGKVEFPEVNGEGVYIRYVPKAKALIARKRKKDIDFFKGQAKLDGSLVLRPKGMIGNGKMTFDEADLTAKIFRYGKETIDSDTAAFKLNSFDLGSLAFKTSNVNAHVDFSMRVGEFKSNDEDTFVEFPANEYICYMDKFRWYMDEDQIELEAAETRSAADIVIDSDLDLKGSNFYSVNANQDSLNFKAPKARYDLKTYNVYCRDVPYIKVADVQIAPDSGNVIIHQKAVMETLNNATILANFSTKYHNIYGATVDITARNAYTGSGDYDYVDVNNGRQKIHFDEIKIDTTRQTYAVGKISKGDKFLLSPNFEYNGAVRLTASKKFLLFDGGTRVIHDCPGIGKNWMNFVSEINPKDIYIPVQGQLMNADGKPIGAGLVLNPDSISVYSTFLSIKKASNHNDLMAANGFLYFDKRSREYQISNKDKLKERSLPGNFVSMNTENCQVSADGKFNFGTELGMMKLSPIGKIKHDIAKDKTTMSASMGIGFFFNDQALERMVSQINEYPELEPIDITSSTYEQSVREIIGLERADKVIGELSLNGTIKKLPDELIQSIYLADVRFEWNAEEKSYRSVGQIGIGNVLKKQVFKYVDGYIEIKKQRASKGDQIDIYLELDASNWYFFNYSRGLMQTISSDKEYNTIIKETKEDKRKYNPQKGEQPFQFIVASARKKSDFLKRMATDDDD